MNDRASLTNFQKNEIFGKLTGRVAWLRGSH
jgi:hypothetical protein